MMHSHVASRNARPEAVTMACGKLNEHHAANDSGTINVG